jgi:hypothetical protein
MARKRKRIKSTRRRSRRPSLSSPRRTTRRRRKTGLFDSAKTGIMSSLKHNGAGAVGGALFAATRFVKMPLWMRLALGAGGSVGVSMVGMPFVGAGLAGATAYHAAQTLLPATLLNDDGEDLEDAEYVDYDTLQDSGYKDENGNSILQDDNGIMYALNDDGELQAVGDAYELNDSLQNVSMVPLQDAYSLSNPYALASGY